MTPRRTGFSLTEMLIAIAIVALIALMAGPALFKLAPVQRLRGEAQNVAAFMRQARLKAANNQKPVRVTLACLSQNPPAPPPCRLFMQTATYERGDPDTADDDEVVWPMGADMTRHELARQVSVVPGSSKGDGVDADNSPNMPWVIFMPNGRTFSYPKPFLIRLYASDLPVGPDRRGWELGVDSGSGQADLRPINW